uniref:Uncharacterized protein n=1 Tax=Vitrella brassicaformis TaxID=1169539 RepID=A0A7S1K960_9ALVE
MTCGSLLLDIISSVIILLYLWEQNETAIIRYLVFARTALDVWKLSKLVDFTLKASFPFIHLRRKELTRSSSSGGKDDDTKGAAAREAALERFESKCMRVLGGGCLVLVMLVAAYQLVYEKQKSWVSWVIESLAMCAYTGGFVSMTPQLFRNYQLRSVEHLPLVVFCYRFCNTIIDDLFSLLIRMPEMHRMSVFRDDVVFVLLLYQRWIYRKSRPMDDKDAAAVSTRESSEAADKAKRE